MKVFVVLTIILTLLPFKVLAEDVVHLNKDQAAPYEGFLFDKNRTKELRLTEKKLQTSNDNIKLYQEKLSIKDERIKMRDEQINDLAKTQVSNKDSSFFSNSLFFILGSAITMGIVFGVKKAAQ